MNIKEFLEMQKRFDSQHSSKINWSETITDNNIHILEHLIIALVGEVGEAANILKKIIRGDTTLINCKEQLTDEVVDVFIYILKLIYQLDIDIELEYNKKIQINTVRFEKYLKKI